MRGNLQSAVAVAGAVYLAVGGFPVWAALFAFLACVLAVLV
jgi:hypothetical protein